MHMYELISGGIMIGFWVGGLMLYGFYKQEKSRLLLKFAIAFWMLSLERLVLGFLGLENEPAAPVYLIRLSAFTLIIIAIIQENRSRGSA